MSFTSGSAYSMARDVAEGYTLVTERTFLRLVASELDQLGFELDRYLRELRGEATPQDDVLAIQQKNRKLQRLTSCIMMLRAYRQKKRV